MAFRRAEAVLVFLESSFNEYINISAVLLLLSFLQTLFTHGSFTLYSPDIPQGLMAPSRCANVPRV
jgi:hypothetical protein